jgi:hypothetical protein
LFIYLNVTTNLTLYYYCNIIILYGYVLFVLKIWREMNLSVL